MSSFWTIEDIIGGYFIEMKEFEYLSTTGCLFDENWFIMLTMTIMYVTGAIG